MSISKNILLASILVLIALSSTNTIIIMDKQGLITGHSTHTANVSLSLLPQEFYCGDLVCSINETCSNCPTDCGQCPVIIGGGGGGGGSTCTIEWECNDWDSCTPVRKKWRTCYNIGTCKNIVSKQEFEDCVYISPKDEDDQGEDEQEGFIPEELETQRPTFKDRANFIFLRIDLEDQTRVVNIRLNEYSPFNLEGQRHYVQLREINDFSLGIGIYSEPFAMLLDPEATYTVDIDGDSETDLYITLEDHWPAEPNIEIILREVPIGKKVLKRWPAAEKPWIPAFLISWALILIILANAIWLLTQVKKHNKEEEKIKKKIKRVKKR